MKVYRGPSSKPFSNDSHELVAEFDVAKVTALWHESILLKVNLTKEPIERQSVAHIDLTAADVLALQQRLMAGLLARSANFDKYVRRIAELRKGLQALFDQASGVGEDREQWLLDAIDPLLELCEPPKE